MFWQKVYKPACRILCVRSDLTFCCASRMIGRAGIIRTVAMKQVLCITCRLGIFLTLCREGVRMWLLACYIISCFAACMYNGNASLILYFLVLTSIHFMFLHSFHCFFSCFFCVCASLILSYSHTFQPPPLYACIWNMRKWIQKFARNLLMYTVPHVDTKICLVKNYACKIHLRQIPADVQSIAKTTSRPVLVWWVVWTARRRWTIGGLIYVIVTMSLI